MNQNFSHDQTPFPQQVHLTDYLNIIRKRKWVAIIVFLLVVCVSAYMTYKTTPVYKATTQIIIEGQSSIIDDMTNIMATEPRKDYRGTQYILLMSRSLASKAIEGLRLREYLANRAYKKPDILTLTLGRFKNFIGTILSPSDSDNSETQRASLIEQSKSEHVPKDKDPVVSWYLSKLEIEPIEETHLTNISFMDQSPKMVARIANAHARAFIEKNLHEKHLVSQQALDWLKAQIRKQKIKVETSQRKVNEYKYNQLASLSIDDEILFSLPEIMQNSAIQELRSRLINLKTQKLEMTTKYGPKYPMIVEIKSSIKKFEQEIITEMKRIRMTIKTKLDQASVLEKSIQQIQDLQQQVTVPLNGKVIKYGMLQFEAEIDQEIYDILLKQAKELSLTANMESKNIRIVDEAEVPRFPFEPNIFKSVILSVVMGFVLGTGLAFFFEYMDKTIRTPEDIMQHLGMSVIGMLPYEKSLKGNKQLALPLNKPHNAQKKRIKDYDHYNISSSLTTNFPLMQSGMSGQVFMVESATSGEGKSTVLSKSAISLARGGLRVVMVDADKYRPVLHHMFWLKNNGDGGLKNAMKKIMSQKIRKGKLNECNMDDLFFLITLKRQSGRLTITHDTQSMTAVFENGHLIHLQSQDTPFANRLGSMLLRGGFITESQLKDALERNKRTGQPLGYILVNSGYISPDQLKGPSKLQMEEHLQKLFSWKQGTFVFEPGGIETHKDKKLYFQEDYAPIINRLGRMVGNHLLEGEVLSHVKSVNEPNLSLLPAGAEDTDSHGPLYYALLAKFLDILKQRFDVILVDMPPVLETMGNVKSLVSLADGIIFVVKSGHVSIKAVNEATNHLKETKTKIIGTILNGVKIGRDYYKYYGYYR